MAATAELMVVRVGGVSPPNRPGRASVGTGERSLFWAYTQGMRSLWEKSSFCFMALAQLFFRTTVI